MTAHRTRTGGRNQENKNSHSNALKRDCTGNGFASSGLHNAYILAFAPLGDGAGLGDILGPVAVLGVSASDPASLGCPEDAARRAAFVDAVRCRVIWRLVAELFASACDRDLPEGAARRRPRCHMRQIAMYLSHVVLSVPYRTIATAFHRDRTTVVHACSVVEDRRDDAGYDRFVEQCERCIKAVFAPLGQDDAEF